MSNSEKREDSRKVKNCSDDESHQQFENRDINFERTRNENSTYVINSVSENNPLHFSRSLEVSNQFSNQPPALLSQAPNIDKLNQNTDVDSTKKRGSRPFVSQNNYLSPRQDAEISPMSALEDSEIRESKTSQKDMSPLSCGRKADFTSPPDQGSVSMIKSLSQNLNEVNTPSLEKRGFRSEAVSPPVKRLRKTPENNSSKPGSQTESYRSNLSFSAPAKISSTSPINLEMRQAGGAVQMNEETGYTHTPSIGKARKRNDTKNKTVQSGKVANDHFLPIITSSDTSLEKGKIDQNRSDSSIRTPAPYMNSRSESIEVLNLSRRGMHRRSASDGALTSRNSTKITMEHQQSNSSVRSNLKETRFSSNLREALKGFTPETCNVNPPSPESPSIPARNINLSTINSHSGGSNRVMSEVTENRPSSESPTSRNQPEVPLQLNRNVPLHQRRHEGLFTDETFPSRKPSEMVSGVNIPYIDIVEGQPSTSRYQPLVRDLSFAFEDAATSRNQHEMASRVYSPNIPATEGQASTSRGNIVNSRSSFNPLDTSSGQPPTSDSSHTDNAGERARDKFDPNSEYIVEARHLLQLVLRRLLGEVEFHRRFEDLFNCISLFSTKVQRFYLSLALADFLADRGYYLWSRSLDRNLEWNIETVTEVAFQRLVPAVVRTIALTLGVGNADSDFEIFLTEFSNFKRSVSDFHIDSLLDVMLENTLDEASNNRLKRLRKKFENLRLLSLSAFRLLLMYIGENSDEESMERFEYYYVSIPRNRMFLRRDIS